jgi:hypothetical protein
MISLISNICVITSLTFTVDIILLINLSRVSKIFYNVIRDSDIYKKILAHSEDIDIIVRIPTEFPLNKVKLFETAMTNGQLSIIKWLHRGGFNPYSIFKANYMKPLCNISRHGHTHILDWLHNNGHENNSVMSAMINVAIKYNQLNVIKWYHEHKYYFKHRPMMYLPTIMKCGNVDILDWFYHKKYIKHTTIDKSINDLLSYAHKNNHTSIIKWFHDNNFVKHI